jgi:heme a synthase
MKFWAWFVLVFTILTILAGGIVRTTHSGMGCPDWPTCFGRWIPPMYFEELPADYEKYLRKQDIDHTFNAFHTWVEYINRLLAALLGVFAIIQLFVAWRKKLPNKNVIKLARAFLIIVIITGLFGALVVRYNLQHYSISVHMALALLLLGIQVALVTQVYNGFKKIAITTKLNMLVLTLLFIVIIQIALGTGVRMHIDNISALLKYQERDKWLAVLPTIFIVHRTISWLVLALLFTINYFCYKEQSLKKQIIWLNGIVLSTIIIGIVMAWYNIPAWAQPIHITLSSCLLAQLLFIVFKTKKTA